MSEAEELLLHWEQTYIEHFSLLCDVAVWKFQIPPDDAEDVVHDVLVAYVQTSQSVREISSWLVAATCNASRNYWRREGRSPQMEQAHGSGRSQDGTGLPLDDGIDIGKLLDRLPERHQAALRLRYLEGCTAREIAKRLDTTPKYVEKLLRQALAGARGESK